MEVQVKSPVKESSILSQTYLRYGSVKEVGKVLSVAPDNYEYVTLPVAISSSLFHRVYSISVELSFASSPSALRIFQSFIANSNLVSERIPVSGVTETVPFDGRVPVLKE